MLLKLGQDSHFESNRCRDLGIVCGGTSYMYMCRNIFGFEFDRLLQVGYFKVSPNLSTKLAGIY